MTDAQRAQVRAVDRQGHARPALDGRAAAAPFPQLELDHGGDGRSRCCRWPSRARRGTTPASTRWACRSRATTSTYGITPNGMSTEAVGYTQFGLVWANPFIVAAARRGDNLLTQNHHRAMIDWYLQIDGPPRHTWTEPRRRRRRRARRLDGCRCGSTSIPTTRRSISSGRTVLNAGGKKALTGDFHLIEPCSGRPTGSGGARRTTPTVAALSLPTVVVRPDARLADRAFRVEEGRGDGWSSSAGRIPSAPATNTPTAATSPSPRSAASGRRTTSAPSNRAITTSS